MKAISVCILFLSIVASCFFLCNRFSKTELSVLTDSLNRISYSYHYKNLDSCKFYAERALASAGNSSVGMAQAYNNLAFHSFMKMDFVRSRYYLQKVYALCNNELELLVADIGMMKICQRTSENKLFYDYRNSALKRMKRIDADIDAFDFEERLRLLFARSEFHIVSSIYFYYLQQLPQSIAEIEQIDVNTLPRDTAQLLYYYYMKGSGGLCKGENLQDITLKEFDYLGRCLVECNDYLYFRANCLQAYAEMLNDSERMAILEKYRSQALQIINAENIADSLLPVYLAEKALDKFKLYGDIYQIAGVYRTIASCLIRQNKYEAAVDSLRKALDCVSFHHSYYYSCNDSVHRLPTYRMYDTIPMEIRWMNDKNIQTVPEWIARIREQLSIAYAGMGLKNESDYNRNIYLDILDVVRQDKELESRYDSLESESSQLSFWLISVVVILVLFSLLFVWLNRKWRKNNILQIEKLKASIEFCRRLLAEAPLNVSEEDELGERLTEVVSSDLEQIFHCKLQIKVVDRDVTFEIDRNLSKEERSLLKVIRPYVVWVFRSSLYFLELGGERKQLEKEKYILEQHIIENKRQNIVKKACVSIVTGIIPYIDRIINETHKLLHLEYLKNENIKNDKIAYINELVTRINEYNEILALWIKMRQGELSLNIETFALNDLFDILAKSRRTFEMKNQTLEVKPTQCIVKADKALTLFMINTLAENARKYSFEKGHVSIYAEEREDCIEISVKDNGRGLSDADISYILNEKVYDSARIGMNNGKEYDEDLKRNKGNGFGLMNCKGIIEKYRKTNDLFKVCMFSVESELGKGSRFFFRLPKGVRKVLSMFLCILATGIMTSCNENDSSAEEQLGKKEQADYYNDDLMKASQFADSVYFSNVYREYEHALAYADSSIYYLNKYYVEHSANRGELMKLVGEGDAAEIGWFVNNFETDYHVILDIRNESAVAFLALKEWKKYSYNNAAYTYLYKLLSRDTSLEAYCKEMEHSTINKTVSIVLCLTLLFVFLIGYYLLYFRHRMLYRFNLEQILLIDKILLSASSDKIEENQDWKAMWARTLGEAYESMNDLVGIYSWGIAVKQEDSPLLQSVFYPVSSESVQVNELVNECYRLKRRCLSPNATEGSFPLIVEWNGEESCIGVLVFCSRNKLRTDEILLLELVARYVAILVMNNIVRVERTYRDLEEVRDNKQRANHEENMLHIQNQVLDNCLSTIKHETSYYPNRVKQIVGRMMHGLPAEEEKKLTTEMEETMSYYRDIFMLLSSCASRQLENLTFRRETINVDDLVESAIKYVKRMNKKVSFQLDLQLDAEPVQVIGDAVLLVFLLENLLHEAFSFQCEGNLYLNIRKKNDFVKFVLTDSRRNYSREELDMLFYPNIEKMKDDRTGELKGTEFLICKQIIREHDEYTGKRGCRINAETVESGGFCIWFTVPCKK